MKNAKSLTNSAIAIFVIVLIFARCFITGNPWMWIPMILPPELYKIFTE